MSNLPQSHSKNSFDFLRLVFALMVIITHSYPLTGTRGEDLLGQVTDKQLRFSELGLAGFFIISGFLILKSLLTSQSINQYLVKRVLRIYPGLFAALIVTVLVSAAVSREGITEFFTSTAPYRYLAFKLSMFGPMPHGIGSAFETNPFPSEVNGSLWTIPYEFFFYLSLIPLFFLRTKKKAVTWLLIAAYVCILVIKFKIVPVPSYILNTLLWPFRSLSHHNLFSFAVYFFGGSLLFLIHPWIEKHKKAILLSSVLLALASIVASQFHTLKYFLLPFFVISFGLMHIPAFSKLTSRMGDLSYGVYIYAFLIQQTLVHFFRPDHLALTLATIPIAMIMGYLSWTFIEKKALRLKTLVIGASAPEAVIVKNAGMPAELPQAVVDMNKTIR